MYINKILGTEILIFFGDWEDMDMDVCKYNYVCYYKVQDLIKIRYTVLTWKKNKQTHFYIYNISPKS